MILCLFILIRILYLIYLNLQKKIDSYLFCIKSTGKICLPTKIIKIGLIIPVTSNKRNYTDIQDIDFIRFLLPSFKNHMNSSGMYIYNFYLGYDHDDQYYVDNKEEIINYLQTQSLYITFTLLPIYNKKSKLSEIWTELAFYAIQSGNVYLYQLGDDIEFYDSNWEYYFIKQLEIWNNIGVVGPLDLNNRRLLTQSFVHKTHVEIFNHYFPKEIKNLYVDNWIENVYKSVFKNRSLKFLNISVKNSGGDVRYKIDKNAKKIYIRQLEIGKRVLKNYRE